MAALKLRHPGDSYSYKFTYQGKTLVYATDVELNDSTDDFISRCIAFFSGADAIIFDTQYTARESFEKLTWGHSSTWAAIDMAVKCKIKKVIFFHHEPSYSDEELFNVFEKAWKYRDMTKKGKDIELYTACEGMTIKL